VEFEFDQTKSQANKAKHGIDFVEAQSLWHDELRIETPALSSTELRVQVLGMFDGKIWSAFITFRETRVRIISVRRARDEEKETYYGR
jgi:hypothetical protein